MFYKWSLILASGRRIKECSPIGIRKQTRSTQCYDGGWNYGEARLESTQKQKRTYSNLILSIYIYIYKDCSCILINISPPFAIYIITRKYCHYYSPILYNHYIIKLPFIHSLQWYIQATCATQGEGLYDGLDWLSQELVK